MLGSVEARIGRGMHSMEFTILQVTFDKINSYFTAVSRVQTIRGSGNPHLSEADQVPALASELQTGLIHGKRWNLSGPFPSCTAVIGSIYTHLLGTERTLRSSPKRSMPPLPCLFTAVRWGLLLIEEESNKMTPCKNENKRKTIYLLYC